MTDKEFENIKHHQEVSGENNGLLHELVDSINEQKDRLKRIESALLGDPKLGNEGFIERYKRTEQQVEENSEKIRLLADYETIRELVEKNEDRINKIYWTVGGAAVVITVVINVAIQYFL